VAGAEAELLNRGGGGRVLVVGLGNPVLRDDAVGIRLARDFRQRWEGRDGAGDRSEASPQGAIDLHFIEECSVGGLTLAEQLAGYDRGVILDSMRTRDGCPGDWYSFTASALRPTMNLGSVHDVNFATALELGRRTGLALPPDEQIVIFAVEIEDNLTFDERMSDALEKAYPRYSRKIFREIERLLGQ
jgi:hydrogenase maturation protease